MLVDSNTSLKDTEEMLCSIKNCRKLTSKPALQCLPIKDTKLLLKYQLENNDLKDDYMLVKAPVYLPKSAIEEKDSLQDLETLNNIENSDNLNKELEHPIQENALERCRKGCLEGKCSLKELFEVCEKDPDSILNACRYGSTNEKCAPISKSKENIEDETLISIKMTHGEILGDAKYHYLMVDASTNTHSTIFTEKMSEHSLRDIHIAKSSSKLSLTQVTPALPAPITAIPEKEGKEIALVLAEEETPESYSGGRRRTSILWSSDTEEKTSMKYSDKNSDKRHSAVSFSGVRANTSEILEDSSPDHPPTDSLEKVVLEATAKANSYRLRQTDERHKSTLLGDIIREEKKKSTIPKYSLEVSEAEEENEKEIEDTKPKKKFCNFIRGRGAKKSVNKNAKKKKSISKNEKNQNDVDSEDQDEDSSSDGENSNRDSASSGESYKRRQTPVEHPVFEKENKLNKYLNNL